MDTGISDLPLPVALQVTTIASAVGIKTDQLRLVICLLGAIPLGLLHKRLPTPTIRHISAAILGLLYLFFIEGREFLLQVFSSLFVYLFVYAFLPRGDPTASVTQKARNQQRRKTIGIAMFIFAMGFLVFFQVLRYIYRYMNDALDFSGPQMILTFKLVSFTYARIDGEEIHEGGTAGGHSVAESAYRAARSLQRTPSLLEYLGYIFFFPGVYLGPCFDISAYLAYSDNSLFQREGLTAPPATLLPALKKLIAGLIIFIPYTIGDKIFPVMGHVGTPQFVIDHPTFWSAFWYVNASMLVFRYKFHFVWYVAEAGCVAAGIGFSGRDPKTGELKFDRCSNSKFFDTEFGTCSQQIANGWNVTCSEWLKHYVYYRVERPDWRWMRAIISHKMFANIAVKFTSALWHGVYPGYYLSFLCVALLTPAEDTLRAIFQPLVSSLVPLEAPAPSSPTSSSEPGSPTTDSARDGAAPAPTKRVWKYPAVYVYNVAAWVALTMAANYFFLPFALLEASFALRVWSVTQYVPHMIAIALGLLGFVLPKRGRADKVRLSAVKKVE